MKFLFTLFFVFIHSPSIAQETGGSFVDGVKAYESQNYEQAKTVFTSLLQAHPTNPSLLYNLGLSYYQLGQKGLALGLWRKARYFSPSQLHLERAIDFTEAELFPNQQSNTVFATINRWLEKLSLTGWLLLGFLLSAIIGWNGVTHFAKRKTPFLHWPHWIHWLIPLWVFVLIFSLRLSIVSARQQATIVTADALARTSPSATAPSLFNLPEGLLVQVKKWHGNFAQIKTDSGSSGWIAKDAILSIQEEGK